MSGEHIELLHLHLNYLRQAQMMQESIPSLSSSRCEPGLNAPRSLFTRPTAIPAITHSIQDMALRLDRYYSLAILIAAKTVSPAAQGAL